MIRGRGYVWLISAIAAFGGLLFGYDWVVIGGAKPFYEAYFGLATPGVQGWAMSCALIGALAGASVSGMAADRWGRKRLLLVSAALFTLSSVATGLAETFGQFVAFRIAGGAAIGLASSISPMYIAEVAPAQLRGRLISLNQLTIVVGILLAQVVNWRIARPVPPGAGAPLLAASWNGQVGWRLMFAATAVPALVFLFGSVIVPESPRWLAQRGRGGNALRVLADINGARAAERALGEIQATLRAGSERVAWSELWTPKFRGPLIFAIGLAVFQQWCGINVVFNYAQEVFAAAGYSVSAILLNIVITGTVNLIFTLLAIAGVDRLGRRALMLLGSAGLAAVYAALGVGYATGTHGPVMLVLVLMAIACYAVSLAPVTWVLMAEMLPNRVRGLAMSAAVTCLWTACFALTFSFPLLNHALGAAGTFWIYAGICAGGFLVMRVRLRETKGRTLEELEAGGRNPARNRAVS